MSSFLPIRFGVQERPTSVIDEADGIVCDGFHDLCPVEGLDAFRVVNVARAVENKALNQRLSQTSRYSLKPLLDVIQHIHRNRVDHRNLLDVVLEYENHVEVSQVELDALEVNELNVLE